MEPEMPLTRDFKETVLEDMKRNPGFRVAMLREAADAMFTNELYLTKDVLRDYVNATMGFDGLSKELNIPAKSLMRMLGPGGNPQANNLLAIIAALQKHAGVEFHVTSTPVKKKRAAARKRRARTADMRYHEPSHESPRAFAEAGTKFKR
jgi:DNA-binding phage protein